MKNVAVCPVYNISEEARIRGELACNFNQEPLCTYHRMPQGGMVGSVPLYRGFFVTRGLVPFISCELFFSTDFV